MLRRDSERSGKQEPVLSRQFGCQRSQQLEYCSVRSKRKQKALKHRFSLNVKPLERIE